MHICVIMGNRACDGYSIPNKFVDCDRQGQAFPNREVVGTDLVKDNVACSRVLRAMVQRDLYLTYSSSVLPGIFASAAMCAPLVLCTKSVGLP